jgi:hypothetical protein
VQHLQETENRCSSSPAPYTCSHTLLTSYNQQCSLEKPACLTCIKSSRVCTGYARERIFIQHQIPGRDSQKSPATEQPLRPPMVSDGLRIRQKDSGMSLLPKTKSDRSEISKRSRVVQENATKILSPDMRPLYRQQIFSEFLFHYAPGCNAAKLQHSPSHRRDDGTGAWLLIIPSLPDITPALETSLLAVTLAKLGRRCHDSVLVHESLQFYTQALWELQKALWDPKLMYRDETLAACMLLTAYEVTECPTQTVYAWANHMKGCARLVELRGPKSYSSDFSSGLFLTWRLGEVCRPLLKSRYTDLTGDG